MNRFKVKPSLEGFLCPSAQKCCQLLEQMVDMISCQNRDSYLERLSGIFEVCGTAILQHEKQRSQKKLEKLSIYDSIKKELSEFHAFLADRFSQGARSMEGCDAYLARLQSAIEPIMEHSIKEGPKIEKYKTQVKNTVDLMEEARNRSNSHIKKMFKNKAAGEFWCSAFSPYVDTVSHEEFISKFSSFVASYLRTSLSKSACRDILRAIDPDNTKTVTLINLDNNYDAIWSYLGTSRPSLGELILGNTILFLSDFRKKRNHRKKRNP